MDGSITPIEWLRRIAALLDSELLGMLMADRRKQGYSPNFPTFEVSFIVPYYKNSRAAPLEVLALVKNRNWFGYRFNNIGKGSVDEYDFNVTYIVFALSNYPFPTPEELIQVAKEHGLTYEDPAHNMDGYTMRCSPKLWE